MAYLEIKGISKGFQNRQVLQQVSFDVDRSEFVSVLGASGCGKTTLLRMIAGFEKPDAGRIVLNGEDITTQSPQSRNIGVVFQNYALFPHMSVFDNVAYGLRVKGYSASQVKEKTNRTLESVGLLSKASRNVTLLSGGEQQRVAIGRAIITEPRLILLDEPLSNLDYTLRVQTRSELKRLQRELDITTLYVTHDHTEALALSDKIAVIDNGELIQFETPERIYQHPYNAYVAGFVGKYNMFDKKQAMSFFDLPLADDILAAVLPEHLIVTFGGGRTGMYVTDILFGGALTEFLISDGVSVFKSISFSNQKSAEANIGDPVSVSVLKENIRIVHV